MIIKIFSDKTSLGTSAATAIVRAIAQKGRARIIAATGASQFEFLDALTGRPDVDWSKVERFKCSGPMRILRFNENARDRSAPYDVAFGYTFH